LVFAVLVTAAALSAIGGVNAVAADACDSAFKLRKYAGVAESCRARAEAGDAEAQYRLAFVHGRGVGVKLNHRVAAEWYTSAARQGHAKAQGRLGTYYFYGKGVERDLVRAYTWLGLAAKREAGAFRPARDEVKSQMDPAQIAEAEARIKAWKVAR
jgi:TPR repeat protein